MVFAPAGALLVELFHPDIVRPTYKNLAAACGLRHAAVIGQRTDDGPQTDHRRMKFKVSVPEVLQILVENGPENNFQENYTTISVDSKRAGLPVYGTGKVLAPRG